MRSLLLITLVILTWMSCGKDSDVFIPDPSEEVIFPEVVAPQHNNKEQQSFDPSQDAQLTFTDGTVIEIPANTLVSDQNHPPTSDITVTYIPYTNKSDLVYNYYNSYAGNGQWLKHAMVAEIIFSIDQVGYAPLAGKTYTVYHPSDVTGATQNYIGTGINDSFVWQLTSATNQTQTWVSNAQTYSGYKAEWANTGLLTIASPIDDTGSEQYCVSVDLTNTVQNSTAKVLIYLADHFCILEGFQQQGSQEYCFNDIPANYQSALVAVYQPYTQEYYFDIIKNTITTPSGVIQMKLTKTTLEDIILEMNKL